MDREFALEGSGLLFESCVGNLGLIPELGRFPGEGNGYPLQYSGLENSWTEEPGGLQSRRVTKS